MGVRGMTRKRSRPYNLGLRSSFVVDDATRVAWGERLRVARAERGITQSQLADAIAERNGGIGCTRAAVSAWERGVSAPSPEARPIIARALKVPASRLFAEPVAA
jgi:transcriptional regulator with XRE-family HTH domain